MDIMELGAIGELETGRQRKPVMSRRKGPFMAIGCAIAIGLFGTNVADAQQSTIRRMEVLQEPLAGAKDQEAHLWIAEIEPGAKTESHVHPTPRFVYVMEGSVVVEVGGRPPRTYKTGDAFQSLPDIVHIFRNASATEPAKALGFQIAGTGQELITLVPTEEPTAEH